ncbi:MAG: hypothetical protein RL398_3158 [Planctomycetota bacterium]
MLAAVLPFVGALAGGYVYDDAVLIERSEPVRTLSWWQLLSEPLFGAQAPYWRPLTSLTLAIGHALGGAVGVHLLALLLHATNTALAFAWLHRRCGEALRALLAALLFAWHPVQVEAVAWCAAINDPLWAFFALLALRAADRTAVAEPSGRTWPIGAWLLAALLAKENALAVAPLLVLAVPSTARPGTRKRTAAAIALAVAAWWLLRIWVFGGIDGGFGRAPAPPPLQTVEALATARLLLMHLGLWVAPVGLTPFRDFVAGPLATELIAVGVVLAGLGAAWWQRHRLAATPRLAMLAATLPLLPNALLWRTVGGSPIGERYLYFATFGATALLGWHLRGRARWLLAGLLPVAAWLSIAQTASWRDEASLIRRSLAAAPESPAVHLMAGHAALRRAQTGDAAALAAAEGHFALAARVAVERGDAMRRVLGEARLGEAWCLTLRRPGTDRQSAQARIEAFAQSLRADADNAAAWIGLGVAHGMAGNLPSAEEAIRRGLRLDAGNAEGWCNLGFVQLQQQRPDQAAESLRRALAIDAGNARAAELLARVQR